MRETKDAQDGQLVRLTMPTMGDQEGADHLTWVYYRVLTCSSPGRSCPSPSCPPGARAWPPAGGSLAPGRGSAARCRPLRTPRTGARGSGRQTARRDKGAHSDTVTLGQEQKGSSLLGWGAAGWGGGAGEGRVGNESQARVASGAGWGRAGQEWRGLPCGLRRRSEGPAHE